MTHEGVLTPGFPVVTFFLMFSVKDEACVILVCVELF